MKKKISVIAIALVLSLVGFGQFSPNPSAMVNPNALTLDTVTNSTAEGPTIYAPGKAASISFTVEITKISGTIAGKIYLRARNRTSGNYGIIATDTLRDQSDVYSFSNVPKSYTGYQVLIAPSGTSSLSYRGTTFFTKPD